MSFHIIGTGSAHPACSQTNDDLAKIMDTSDEWIYSRTGIKSRYVCTNETITDVAADAAQSALENAGINADELDAIICPTISGDYFTPALACCVQRRIGARCPAFDLNAACTGFIYALDVADGFFVRGRAKKILVVAGENMSKLLDWHDRSTCCLFGDGAGAVVLAEGDGLLSVRVAAYGNEETMSVPDVGGKSPFNRRLDQSRGLNWNGQDVYRFAVGEMTSQLKEGIREAGLEPKNVTWVLPHQANLRIIDTAIKHLDIPPERFLTNIEHYGNTSSAAIPILMDEFNRRGTFHSGDILALVAFGGGLTSGSCLIRWG